MGYNTGKCERCDRPVYYTLYPSPLGVLILTGTDNALTGLYLPAQNYTTQGLERCDGLPLFTAVIRWLDAYFEGNHREIDFPLSPAGTPFQTRVWQLLRTIPRGKTLTYGQIAARLDNPRASQAVGQAVGRNPISIIIPCHRCVGAGGRLTGYAGGLEAKQWLLRHEEVIL